MSGAPWSLAKGGRSVTCGAIKVRAEGKSDAVTALMARIVRLPELEMIFDAVSGMDPGDAIGSVKVHYADRSTRWLVEVIAEIRDAQEQA